DTGPFGPGRKIGAGLRGRRRSTGQPCAECEHAQRRHKSLQNKYLRIKSENATLAYETASETLRENPTWELITGLAAKRNGSGFTRYHRERGRRRKDGRRER